MMMMMMLMMMKCFYQQQDNSKSVWCAALYEIQLRVFSVARQNRCHNCCAVVRYFDVNTETGSLIQRRGVILQKIENIHLAAIT
jgi:hypothetical protein